MISWENSEFLNPPNVKRLVWALIYCTSKTGVTRKFLVVKWLGHHTFTIEGLGWISGSGAEILQAEQHGQKHKTKQNQTLVQWGSFCMVVKSTVLADQDVLLPLLLSYFNFLNVNHFLHCSLHYITVLCQFQMYSKMIQLYTHIYIYVYIYSFSASFPLEMI